MSRKIILAGGSGFLGSRLAETLLEGHYEPLILTRHPRGGKDLLWDARTIGPWAKEIEGAQAVVNLAGRSVNCRHTPQNRAEIISSRVDSVRAIGAAIRACAAAPRVWVQAASS